MPCAAPRGAPPATPARRRRRDGAPPGLDWRFPTRGWTRWRAADLTDAPSAAASCAARPADMADKRAIHAIAGAAAAVVGPIDVLVHNASTLGPTPLRLLLDTECEDLGSVLETNLIGPFRLTRVIAGAMALRGSGVVVHVSSDAAVAAYPRWGAYGVSKAALDHLNRTWAVEVPEVRFLAVDPGEMDTDMHAAAIPDADRAALARPQDVARKIARMIADCDRIESGSRGVVTP